MKTSEGRILTTHAGSLPRTDKLAKLLIERDNDVAVDDDEMRREVERAIDWLVAKQLESGVDIGSEGRRLGSDSRPTSVSAFQAGAASLRARG